MMFWLVSSAMRVGVDPSQRAIVAACRQGKESALSLRRESRCWLVHAARRCGQRKGCVFPLDLETPFTTSTSRLFGIVD